MRVGHIAHFSVPTEEIPGGVDLVPVRHAVTRTVPSVTLGAPISAVSFSLDAAEESFVEPGKEYGLSQLDVLFMETEEEEEFTPSIYEESWEHMVELRRTALSWWWGAVLCHSAFGQILSCLLACFLSLLSLGFAGAAGLSEGSSGSMPPGDVRPTAIPPHEYWRPEGLYGSQHTPGHAVWHPGPSQPHVVVCLLLDHGGLHLVALLVGHPLLRTMTRRKRSSRP
ncbi:hypothetical protein CYMTET_4042 [Cymbomonas tetramitiformis]|uniref:Uncharacterized protein n=1 Tax=Cymbomonas tetramitiformis TaxID=36881 RepID=A0AAE0H272_9CHLO|nr:hypothetical protein CYMTET_4042 [Cymbomonas tetramitiformis]